MEDRITELCQQILDNQKQLALKLHKIEKRLNKLENDEPNYKWTDSKSTYKNKKLTESDFKSIYDSGFDKFYEMALKHARWEDSAAYSDDDPYWDVSKDSNNIYVKLANLVGWFGISDVPNIIKMIISYNKNPDNEDKIASADVEDYNNEEQWNKALVEQIRSCVVDMFTDGIANEKHQYKHIQRGRIHFVSKWHADVDNPENFLGNVSFKLYWTNAEWEEE